MTSRDFHGPEFFIRFGDWCRNHRVPVTAELIKGNFGVSKATAHRWLRAWKDATGQP